MPYCTNCAFDLNEVDGEFCPNCGAPLENKKKNSEKARKKKGNVGTVFIIIACICVVLASIAVAIKVLFPDSFVVSSTAEDNNDTFEMKLEFFDEGYSDLEFKNYSEVEDAVSVKNAIDEYLNLIADNKFNADKYYSDLCRETVQKLSLQSGMPSSFKDIFVRSEETIHFLLDNMQEFMQKETINTIQYGISFITFSSEDLSYENENDVVNGATVEIIFGSTEIEQMPECGVILGLIKADNRWYVISAGEYVIPCIESELESFIKTVLTELIDNGSSYRKFMHPDHIKFIEDGGGTFWEESLIKERLTELSGGSANSFWKNNSFERCEFEWGFDILGYIYEQSENVIELETTIVFVNRSDRSYEQTMSVYKIDDKWYLEEIGGSISYNADAFPFFD